MQRLFARQPALPQLALRMVHPNDRVGTLVWQGIVWALPVYKKPMPCAMLLSSLFCCSAVELLFHLHWECRYVAHTNILGLRYGITN